MRNDKNYLFSDSLRLLEWRVLIKGIGLNAKWLREWLNVFKAEKLRRNSRALPLNLWHSTGTLCSLILICASIKQPRQPTFEEFTTSNPTHCNRGKRVIKLLSRQLAADGRLGNYLITKWYHQSGLNAFLSATTILSISHLPVMRCRALLIHDITQINDDDVCRGCSLSIHVDGDNMQSFIHNFN